MSGTPEADRRDGASAIRGVTVRIGGYVTGALLGLGSSALLFRQLGPEASGQFVTVQSLALLAAGVTDAGLTTIGVREYAARSGTDRRTVMRDLLGLRILLTTIGVVGAVVFAVAVGYSGVLVAGTAIMGFAVFCGALQHALGVGLAAELRQGWITVVDFSRQAVTAAVIAMLVVLDAGLLPFFWAQVAGGVVAVALLGAVVHRAIPLRPGFAAKRWRELLGDTLPYALATAVSVVYFQLTVILMSLTASAAETGYFAAGFRGVSVIVGIPALAGAVVFPIFVRAALDDRERLAYALGRVLDASLPAGLAVAIALGIGAPTVILVVAGPDFEGANDVLRIQGLTLLLSFMGAGLSFALLAVRAHRTVLVANVLALITSAALVPTLSSGSGGAIGAAVAVLVADVVLAGSMAVGLHRAGVSLRLDPKLLRRVLAAFAIALLPALLVGLDDAIRATLCEVAFVLALLGLRALPPELREHLPVVLR